MLCKFATSAKNSPRYFHSFSIDFPLIFIAFMQRCDVCARARGAKSARRSPRSARQSGACECSLLAQRSDHLVTRRKFWIGTRCRRVAARAILVAPVIAVRGHANPNLLCIVPTGRKLTCQTARAIVQLLHAQKTAPIAARAVTNTLTTALSGALRSRWSSRGARSLCAS